MPGVFESDGFGKNANILAAFTVFCLMKITGKPFLLIFSKININRCESCPVTDNKRTIPQSKCYPLCLTPRVRYYDIVPKISDISGPDFKTGIPLIHLTHRCSKNQSYLQSYSSCWPISSCFV